MNSSSPSPGDGAASQPPPGRQRVRACANLAAIAERRRARNAGRDVRRHAEQRKAEAYAFKDHLPLYDADWSAVYELAHGLRDFARHTGPAAPAGPDLPPSPGARRIARHTRSRLRATYDGERWLAIWVLLRGGTGAPTIAELLGINERQIARWVRRPTLGWPHGPDAILMPTAGAAARQCTTDPTAIGSIHRARDRRKSEAPPQQAHRRARTSRARASTGSADRDTGPRGRAG